MLGIIRVLTTEKQEVLQEHGRKMENLYKVRSVTHCIPEQPNGIYDEQSEKEAVPKIIELAQQMHAQYDLAAITISCAADPALDETRVALDIPVLGAGTSGAHAAAMVGSKVGIIGITDAPPSRMKEELGNRFFSYDFSPNLRKTTDLFSDGAKEELLKVVKGTIQSGADVILFACTGFSTIRLKDYLVEQVNVPIVDLVEAQAIAFQLIKGGVRNE
ncbi:aspartate/glutamate racemase family protein [Planomicrobium sp. CPCC 101079]|uniref:aspartate/glutamate racemase family protein n=1 Tax=Planomicrobium sp. CPCC 101079 TaxID=2599618 RepID=UPI00164639AB|nr:aspartate/glutamate racemase family protein [Planomicrobium sp. CPCC 101079]